MSFTAQLEEWAVAAGATHVRVVVPDHLVVKPEVLASCAANACGKYGRCWTCPPLVASPEEMTASLQRYSSAVLIQNISSLEGSWDSEGMEAAMKAHNQMVRDLWHQLLAAAPDVDVLPLGCGGCGFCEKCPCPDKPCRFPEQAISSVEGYGMDVKALVQSCGLQYINGVNTVSYVGALLLR